jgi:hypothetical protein
VTLDRHERCQTDQGALRPEYTPDRTPMSRPTLPALACALEIALDDARGEP